jgi:hypothetical protein
MTDPTTRAPIPDAAPPADETAVTAAPAPAVSPPPAAPAAQATSAPVARSRSGMDDPGRLGSIIFGLVILAIGLWFLADESLGLAMPDIDWGRFWPVILILIGAWILLGARRRGAR